MKAHVPTSLVDNEYELFPAGTFVGKLSGATLRENSDGSRVSLRVSIGDTQPADEEQPDTNGRTFSGDVAVRWDGQSVTEIADFSDDNLPFPLRLGAARLAGLAECVGAAERDTETGTVSTDFARLIEALQDGAFEGETVGFSVQHRSYENANGDEVETDDFAKIGIVS